MNGKDFKFDDDAFDDVFSSSDNDKFEDVYSDDEHHAPQKKRSVSHTDDGFENEFEDIFSGKDEVNDSYEQLSQEYDMKFTDNKPQPRRPVNTNVEKKPYSYNYNKAAQNKARRVSQDKIYDDVAEDLYSGKQPKEKKKKKNVGGKVVAVILVLVLLVAAFGGIGGYSYAKSLTKKVNYSPLDANQYIDSANMLRKDGVKNILLVGVDARKGESNDATRSDTMMLLTIDDNNKQIKLTSFLRDTYIEIPGYKWAKLNAAQSHGGTQLLVDTIEYNYKVDIDNYMLVNFDMFTTIIDSLGGVSVEVTEKEADYINSKDHMTLSESAAFPNDITEGPAVHFSGAQALWYARMRYLDSDFMRTQRQRKVISAIVTKAKSTNPATLLKMLEEIMPMIETDLSSDDMISLGMNALGYMKYEMAQQQIPAEGTWTSASKNGQSVLSINLEKNQNILKTFVFEKATVEAKTEATTNAASKSK